MLCCSRKSFWVIYRHGVYDVTSFLPSHPGGEQILNAGGLSIEPFWNVYGMHKTKEIFEILESYRIGKNSNLVIKYESRLKSWNLIVHRALK